MEIILNIGAHRCATTSFQAYMRANADQLAGHGIGFWGPGRTRNGLLSGVLPVPGPRPPDQQFTRACGRIALACTKAERQGLRMMLVSDENMIGTPRASIKAGLIYPHAGARIARHLAAFGGQVTRIGLSIRSNELWWASCMAFAVGRGHPLPDPAQLAPIALAERSWRDVITDIACAAPGVDILVMPHEALGGLPDLRLWQMTGGALLPPMTHARDCLNAAPDLAELRRALRQRGTDPAALRGQGRWMPFDDTARATLRERYQDDLFWLRSGADGLARLASDTLRAAPPGSLTGTEDAGEHLRSGKLRRGRDDDFEQGRMVGNR